MRKVLCGTFYHRILYGQFGENEILEFLKVNRMQQTKFLEWWLLELVKILKPALKINFVKP